MSWWDQIGQHIQQSLGQTGQAFGDFGKWASDTTERLPTLSTGTLGASSPVRL